MRDKAEAMAAYARQAKDSELIQYATEIKVRAERRCGELLRVTAERGERATQAAHGRGVQASVEPSDARPPTLADMGLTRDESSRYQQLAAMPAEHFETAVATAKATAGEVTTAFMLREAAKHKPQGKPMKGKKADAMRQELAEAKQRGVSMLSTYARRLCRASLPEASFPRPAAQFTGAAIRLHSLGQETGSGAAAVPAGQLGIAALQGLGFSLFSLLRNGFLRCLGRRRSNWVVEDFDDLRD